jgi:hypothetical protein
LRISRAQKSVSDTLVLEPPPVIWKAMEINRCYYTRAEASAASREAAAT